MDNVIPLVTERTAQPIDDFEDNYMGNRRRFFETAFDVRDLLRVSECVLNWCAGHAVVFELEKIKSAITDLHEHGKVILGCTVEVQHVGGVVGAVTINASVMGWEYIPCNPEEWVCSEVPVYVNTNCDAKWAKNIASAILSVIHTAMVRNVSTDDSSSYLLLCGTYDNRRTVYERDLKRDGLSVLAEHAVVVDGNCTLSCTVGHISVTAGGVTNRISGPQNQ